MLKNFSARLHMARSFYVRQLQAVFSPMPQFVRDHIRKTPGENKAWSKSQIQNKHRN